MYAGACAGKALCNYSGVELQGNMMMFGYATCSEPLKKLVSPRMVGGQDGAIFA